MIDKIEQYLLEKAESIHNRIQWWSEVKNFYLPLVAKLEELGCDCSVSSCLDISLAGDKAKLHELFKVLRSYGFVPSRRPEPKESYYATYWRRELANGDGEWVWVSFSSTVCKRVQIGTSMQEVAVFETVCSDQLDLPEDGNE